MFDVLSKISNLDSYASGKIIKIMRIWKGLSQEHLGKMANLSINYLSQIEQGRPIRFEKLTQIVKCMDYNPTVAFALTELLNKNNIRRETVDLLALEKRMKRLADKVEDKPMKHQIARKNRNHST